jgi:hypothetical protein
MANLRVDEIKGRAAETVQAQTPARVRRKHLHVKSTYEAQGPATFAGIGKTDLSALKGSNAPAVGHKLVNKSFTFANGQTIQFQGLATDWSAEIEQQRAQLSPEQGTQLNQNVQTLAQAAQAEAAKPSAATGAVPDSMKAPLGRAILVGQGAGMTQDGSTNMVCGSSILYIEGQINGLIGNIEERAQYGTELKAEVTDLEDLINNWRDDGTTQQFSYQDMTVNEDGSATMTAHNNVTLSKSDAQNLLSQLQSEVDSATSMTQTESFKMQMWVQQDQQAVNVLSNILKMSHDDMSQIIANIGKAS